MEPDAVQLGHVGLNHLTWGRSVTVGGMDHLPDRLTEFAAEAELPPELLAELAAVPSVQLRYYYAHDLLLCARRGARRAVGQPHQGRRPRAIERELLAPNVDPREDTKPEALGRRGGAVYSEAAVELLVQMQIGSKHGSDGARPRVVNHRNDGTLPFLPNDHVVEVPARFSDGRFVAEPVEPLPEAARGLVVAVTGHQRLALQAAARGGREGVLAAMRARPLVLQHDRAVRLTDLLAEDARFLLWFP